MIRAFLALPLPALLADLLVPAQAALRLPRPVPAQDFHVTLAFLGEQREDRLEELHAALEALRLPAPLLALDGLGVMGERGVHAAIRPDPGLERLQARVAQAARGVGIALERRRFRPHVTLARGALPDAGMLAAGFARAGAVASPAVRAEILAMYRSRLRPEGSLYDVLAEYPLVG